MGAIVPLKTSRADVLFKNIATLKDSLKAELRIEGEAADLLLKDLSESLKTACNIVAYNEKPQRNPFSPFEILLDFAFSKTYASGSGDCLLDEVKGIIISTSKLGINNADDVRNLVNFVETPLLKGTSRGLKDRIELPNDVKDSVGPSAKVLRKSPGVASASSGLFDSARLLRGNHGNAGLIPKEIGDILAGKSHAKFDNFRDKFWIAVVDSKYANEFSASNIARMKGGGSPLVVLSQRLDDDNRKYYELHHITPINQGGSVYDMSNLMIRVFAKLKPTVLQAF